MNNTKGMSQITIMFYSLMFLILWALFFANTIGEFAHQAVVNGELTGIEAFILENINIVILFIFIVFIIAISFAGGG